MPDRTPDDTVRAMTAFRLVLLCLLAGAASAAARPGDVAGTWLSGDGDGLVEIRLAADGLSGIVLGSPNDDPDRPDRDRQNPDPALRDRPLKGLEIFSGFRYEGQGTWGGGRIYDPNSGNTYRCTIRVIDRDTLELRGYIGIPLFGRTETWRRRGD